MFVDKNSYAIIIRTNPESPLLIDIQTVYIFYRRNILKELESGAIVFEETGIGTNPKLSILCLVDIVCFTR